MAGWHLPFVSRSTYEMALRLAEEAKENAQTFRAELEAANKRADRAAAETRLALADARETIKDAMAVTKIAANLVSPAPVSETTPDPVSVGDADRAAAERLREVEQRTNRRRSR